MRTKLLFFGGALLAACLADGVIGLKAQQQGTPAAIPDLSGGWLMLDKGSGSFDGTRQNFPPAQLTAEGQATTVAGDGRNVIGRAGGSSLNDAPHQAGEAYIVNNGACTAEGTGGSGIDPNSTAWFLLQSKDEVLMIREGPGGRHIYTDGRKNPDPATVAPSMYGHSIGHYEGNALIIETTGLNPGMVQGGGRRRPQTKLTEKLDLAADGKHLTITYTWDDPLYYVKPHSYQNFFERLPAGSYALETWCDASDPLQRQSIVPPKQVQ